MLSKNAQKIYEMKYRKGKEDWSGTCWRVASHVAQAEKEKKVYEKKFFELIHDQIFLPGGRILANSGTRIRNLLNCFVLPVGDSREGIYETLKNAAEIFAHGGGVGYNFSDVRAEGAEIKSTGGKASGPLSFMSMFDQTGEVIQQASRRGAQMGILDIDHPDIERFIGFKSKLNRRNERIYKEFIRNLVNEKDIEIVSKVPYPSGYPYELTEQLMKEAKENLYSILEKTLLDDQLTHFNISIGITDKFMKAVNEDKDWHLISRKKKAIVKTVKARELFRKIAEMAHESGDPGVLFIDRANEDNMVKYLGEIKATNPCVTGDTKILTVYNGAREIKDLVGEDTLIYTWNPETKLPEVSLMRNIHKTRENQELMEIEFNSGLRVKCTPDHNFYSFRGDKVQAKKLRVGQAIRAYSLSIHRDGHLRVHGWVDGKTKHKYVSRLVWEFYHGPIEDNLILHHKDFDKLNNHIDNFELLNPSHHNSVHYPYRLMSGFYYNETKEEALKRVFPNHKIVSIKYLKEKEDVYNGVVDNTHAYIIPDDEAISGVMSGIVSANCGEVPLLDYESCCLGSLNLHKFYEKSTRGINYEFLEYAIRLAVRFLDDVQELTEVPIQEINEQSKNLRRIGLGVMGWADLLAELEIPYDSDEALKLAEYLSWFISFFSKLESINLAQEKGKFLSYDEDKVDLYPIEKTVNFRVNPHKLNMDEVRKVGIRNVATTSIAPTGTISLISGVNSGIEPFYALAYKRNITEGVGNSAKDYIIEINPILFKKLKEHGISDEDIEKIKEYILEFGGLENCDKISDELKSIFKVSHEISPHSHVEMQAHWQLFIDNSISKTINMPEESTIKDIQDIFFYMWNNNLKGGTIYRDKSKQFQILNVGTK